LFFNRITAVLPARVLAALGLSLLLGLSACAPAPRVSGINDPFEQTNREIHEFNKELDRKILRPVSQSTSTAANGTFGTGLDNFASNLSLPGKVVNSMLQLDIVHAFSNTARFALNSTFGLAGLFDVASQNLITEHPTDFGETLHVWGFKEGRYLELPFVGSSTERDAFGMLVDFVMNPLNFALPAPERYVGTVAYVVNRVADRGRYAQLVDQVLYDSADSYAQTRLIYLQSRRRALHGAISEDLLEDPYAE